MGKSERKNKDQGMAADLLRRGLWHGKRATKGLSNVPAMGEVGSAAYRRRIAKVGGRNG